MNATESSLQSCEAFCALIPSQLTKLASHCEAISFECSGQIYGPEDAADHVYVLAEGRVQINHYDDMGRRAIVRTVWPRELFGQGAITPGATRELSSEAGRKSKVIAVPTEQLRQLMLVNPRLTMDVLKNVAEESRRLTHRLASTLLRPKRQRLIDLLNRLSRTQGVRTENGLIIPAIFSHQELSDMIGASRETVTVILGQLKSEGVVSYEGRRIMMKCS